MIEFENITKTYTGGLHAVDGVSLQVERGQCCVLLGASGAGKTTLLRMVNGLVEPTRGQVRVDGQVVTRRTLRTIRKRIGMVHQRFNLSPRLSVLGNVLCGALPMVGTLASLIGWFPPSMRRKACELVAQVGLEETHLYRRAADLSGGQQQRVAIARALMLDPVVVLADEPVASLDPATSRVVLKLLREGCKELGTTMLCSLHQVDLACEFADRIVAMRLGKVIYDGPPAQFTGALQMSIYDSAEKAARNPTQVTASRHESAALNSLPLAVQS